MAKWLMAMANGIAINHSHQPSAISHHPSAMTISHQPLAI
jgi:hypothetical protein